MKLYWAGVSFVYPTSEGLRENTHNIEYESESELSAIEDAKRFGDNRCRTFDDWTLGCIKVGELRIRTVDAHGYLPHNSWGPFFEWKYDWPGTFEIWIVRFKAERMKARAEGWTDA